MVTYSTTVSRSSSGMVIVNTSITFWSIRQPIHKGKIVNFGYSIFILKILKKHTKSFIIIGPSTVFRFFRNRCLSCVLKPDRSLKKWFDFHGNSIYLCTLYFSSKKIMISRNRPLIYNSLTKTRFASSSVSISTRGLK